MFNKFKKVIAVMLAIATMMTSAITARAATEKEVFTVTDNGVTYTIEVERQGDVADLTITSDKSKDYAHFTVDEANELVSSTQYKYRGKTLFGGERYYRNKSVVVDYSNDTASNDSLADELQYETRAVSYGKKKMEKFKERYWYQEGVDGKKEYLKIGCNKTYLIRTDNLSTARQDRCKAYTKAIRDCNTSYDKFLKLFGGSKKAALACAAIIVSALAIPGMKMAAAAGLVMAGMGVTGSIAVPAVTNYVDAKHYYEAAIEHYDIIKLYGKTV